jgi:hypothetical protein
MELVFLPALSIWEGPMCHQATMILLMFEGYLQPGEALNLREEALVQPTAAHPFHSLNLHPLDRMKHPRWASAAKRSSWIQASCRAVLGPLLTALQTGVRQAPMLPVTYQQLKDAWMDSLLGEGLKQGHAFCAGRFFS